MGYLDNPDNEYLNEYEKVFTTTTTKPLISNKLG
jgi:hypothetical protein